MGVHGLWKLLEPAGRRVDVATLRGKTLAVDASIWLTSFVKAMRGANGEMTPNAHLLGTFRRVLRLLFNHIRPVFVFDGGAPALKRRTVLLRQQRRSAQASRYTATVRRLLLHQVHRGRLLDSINSAAVPAGQPLFSSTSRRLLASGAGSSSSAAVAADQPAPAPVESPRGAAATDDVDSDAASDGDADVVRQPKRRRVQFEDAGIGSLVATQRLDKVDRAAEQNLDSDDSDGFSRRRKVLKRKKGGAAAAEPGSVRLSRPRLDSLPCLAGASDSSRLANSNRRTVKPDQERSSELASSSVASVARVGPPASASSEDDEPRAAVVDSAMAVPDNVDDVDLNMVISLPPQMQKEYIEEMQRKRRHDARLRLIPVAADPAAFSAAQLSAFLAGAKFNASVSELHAAQARTTDSGGRRIASDAGREYVLLKGDAALARAGLLGGCVGGGRAQAADDGTTISLSRLRAEVAASDADGADEGAEEGADGDDGTSAMMQMLAADHPSADAAAQETAARPPGGAPAYSVSTSLVGGWPLHAGGSAPPPRPPPPAAAADGGPAVSDYERMALFLRMEQQRARRSAELPLGLPASRAPATAAAAGAVAGHGFMAGDANSQLQSARPQARGGRGRGSFRGRGGAGGGAASAGGGGRRVLAARLAEAAAGKGATLVKDAGINRALQYINTGVRSAVGAYGQSAPLADRYALMLQQQSLGGPADNAGREPRSSAREADTTAEFDVLVAAAGASGRCSEQVIATGIAAESPGAGLHIPNDEGVADVEEAEDPLVALAFGSGSAGADTAAHDEVAGLAANVADETGNGFLIEDGSAVSEKPAHPADALASPWDVYSMYSIGARSRPPQHDGPAGGEDEWEDMPHQQAVARAGADDYAVDVAALVHASRQAQLKVAEALSHAAMRQHAARSEERAISPAVSIASDVEAATSVPQGGLDSSSSGLAEAYELAGSMRSWAQHAFARALKTLGLKLPRQATGEASSASSRSAPAAVERADQHDAVPRGDDGGSAQAEHGGVELIAGLSEEEREEIVEEVIVLQELSASRMSGAAAAAAVAAAEPESESLLAAASAEVPAARLVSGGIEAAATQAAAAGARAQQDLAALEAEEAALRLQMRAASRDTDGLSDGMREEVIELLRAFGLPCVVAPMEAEAQCAQLQLAGLVDGVITDDSDAFLFGASTVYRHIFDDHRFVEAYDVVDVERELGLGRDDLIRSALLLGSDYTDGVKGVGIVNAAEILHAFPGDDGLARFRAWLHSAVGEEAAAAGGACEDEEEQEQEGAKPAAVASHRKRRRPAAASEEATAEPSADIAASAVAAADPLQSKAVAAFATKHRAARRSWQVSDYFPSRQVLAAYRHPTVTAIDPAVHSFAFGQPDEAALAALCVSRFGWTAQRAVAEMAPTLRELRGGLRQAPLEAYMSSYWDTQRSTRIKSARLKAAVAAKAGRLAPGIVADGGAPAGDEILDLLPAAAAALP